MFDPIPPKQLLKAAIRQIILWFVVAAATYIIAFKIM